MMNATQAVSSSFDWKEASALNNIEVTCTVPRKGNHGFLAVMIQGQIKINGKDWSWDWDEHHLFLPWSFWFLWSKLPHCLFNSHQISALKMCSLSPTRPVNFELFRTEHKYEEGSSYKTNESFESFCRPWPSSTTLLFLGRKKKKKENKKIW